MIDKIRIFKSSMLVCLLSATCPGAMSANVEKVADRQSYKIYVDKEGVMRRSDNKEEVSYYGTNYTSPFAYSYRALGYLGKDRKRAIDRDIYHISRLGLNAFRLHLWDAELADSVGNLIGNDHLDLLDYAIAEFEKRGIDIILTAQTNFGNGYPEKNIDTGAFTYDFDKCNIHDDPEAQEIQSRYLDQLARHENPYTGRSYAKDNAIIAMEINNEPCHSGSKEEVTAYINKMAKTLKKAGFDKPILYNVTHNPGVTSAYYDANIDGTTFQWYPTSLVAGHERKGNLLPAFDEYTIPWKDTMKNYDKLAKVVYEFDPADVLYSHLYPAVVRTFRKEGFQWITQFAYDPIDLAPYNTEYPTHFLNLVYTPAKALSMMIAAEAAKEIPRYADYGSYPENTKFGNTLIDYASDLSVYNSPEKFLYTNNTDTNPVNLSNLKQIAGHGSSPVVEYEGSGAYFLDLVPGTETWRLEVMPDAEIIDDPFGNTDLKDAKVVAVNRKNKMKISLPQLGDHFFLRGINKGNDVNATATDGIIEITPGAYLIASNRGGLDVDTEAVVAGNIGVSEYAGPDNDKLPFTLLDPRRADSNLDVNAIPEAWEFKFNKKHTNWDEAPVYELTMNPSEDGILVMRRYVGDKIGRIPEEITPMTLNVRFQKESGDVVSTPLPEGSELGFVTTDGFTYSLPIILDSNGNFSAQISSFRPRKGIVMPAPYPSMLTREYPASSVKPQGLRDIEFVEIIIPREKGKEVTLLPERIWAE
ncbi:MAG: cellulase family glycosylhydrolase [Muribaculaceae bacterium]|nr:cellulase family glycosylhydrolase [Muribaculaceae bacterium]